MDREKQKAIGKRDLEREARGGGGRVREKMHIVSHLFFTQRTNDNNIFYVLNRNGI